MLHAIEWIVALAIGSVGMIEIRYRLNRFGYFVPTILILVLGSAIGLILRAIGA